ncbi:MAG: type II secretion system protein [Verrucomicrobiota bacterium]
MKRNAGFTLVELLTVIGVIAVLSAISFGIAAGVYQRQARTKAAAELSALASSLEAYRAEHGSYPIATGASWEENAETLYQALTGQTDPNGDSFRDSNGSETTKRALVDVSKFELESPENGNTFASDNKFLDPWGNPYVYQYNNDSSSWNRFGFVLFSRGQDGDLTNPSSGIVDKAANGNPDNIYLNE